MIYFIACKEIPETPFWFDIEFVKVNNHPVPFKSIEAAQEYMDAWEMKEPKYSIWKLERV